MCGVHGVHGNPALYPVGVELKRETGPSLSLLSTMARIVWEMTQTLKHATRMAVPVSCL